MFILLTLIAIITTSPDNPYKGWREQFTITAPGPKDGVILDNDGKHPAFSTLHIPITKQQFLFDGRNGICVKFYADADTETNTVNFQCDTTPANGVREIPDSINT